MRAATLTYEPKAGWAFDGASVDDPQIVLWFGAPLRARDPAVFGALRKRFPKALITGCSTGGEILNEEVLDGTAVAAAVRFEHTTIKGVKIEIDADFDPVAAGLEIAEQLAGPDLRALYLLSDGLMVNGAKLIEGVLPSFPPRWSSPGASQATGPTSPLPASASTPLRFRTRLPRSASTAAA